MIQDNRDHEEVLKPIMAVSQQKGGIGKTSLSFNFTAEIQRRNRSPLLVDSDPQESIKTAINEPRRRDSSLSPLPLISYSEEDFDQKIAEFAEGYDEVVIDGGAKLTKASLAPLRAANIILAPIVPGGVEMFASVDFFKVVHEIVNEDQKPRLLLALYNSVPGGPKSALLKKAKEIEDILVNEYNVTFLNNMITRKMVWPMTMFSGRTIHEAKSSERDSDAILELVYVFDEIMTLREAFFEQFSLSHQ